MRDHKEVVAEIADKVSAKFHLALDDGLRELVDTVLALEDEIFENPTPEEIEAENAVWDTFVEKLSPTFALDEALLARAVNGKGIALLDQARATLAFGDLDPDGGFRSVIEKTFDLLLQARRCFRAETDPGFLASDDPAPSDEETRHTDVAEILDLLKAAATWAGSPALAEHAVSLSRDWTIGKAIFSAVLPPWPHSVRSWIGEEEELVRWIEQCFGDQVACDGEPLRDMAKQIVTVLARYGWISKAEADSDLLEAEREGQRNLAEIQPIIDAGAGANSEG